MNDSIWDAKLQSEIIEAQEEEENLVPRPRFEIKVPLVNHRTEVGKLVYEIVGKNAPPLFYAHCNAFVSKALGENYQWWLIEGKLKDVLMWCRKVGANHAGLRTVLNKALK